MTPKALGCIELDRAPSRRYADARDLVGASATPARASMADLVFVPPGFAFADQGDVNECVGWTLTQLVHVRTRAMGLPGVAISPGGTYYGARARRYGWRDVWDGGCNPHEAFEHVREAGGIPYELWPHDARRRNDPPDPECYRHAADIDWIRPHWVLATRRTPVVRALLASRRPVGVALRVDDPFLDWHPGDAPWAPSLATVRGGHDVTIVGYDTLRDGRTVFIVANSHGGSYGDHGFMLLSESGLESIRSTYVCTVEITL